MRWLFKAALQGTLSQLPNGERWNYLIQKNVIHSFADKKGILSRRFEHCNQHLDYYLQFAPRNAMPDTILELGTGWIPTMPIALFLCGANRIFTIDIHEHIRPELFLEVLAYLKTLSLEDVRASLPRVVPERFALLQTVIDEALPLDIHKLLERLNITYLIRDARATDFDPACIDLITSSTTLEHIDEATLNGIFKEFHRVLRPTGLMCHMIDMSDHYGHVDPSITPFNFLKYNPGVWRFFNNELLYQNRLRISDYRTIHANNGFEIVFEKKNVGHKPKLSQIKLAPEFEHYSPDDLAATTAWLISRPI